MLADVSRLAEIDRLLSRRRGATVTEMAKHFRVSNKTIRRDLAFCRELYGRRLLVEEERHGRKRYRVDPQDRMFATWVAKRAKRLKTASRGERPARHRSQIGSAA